LLRIADSPRLRFQERSAASGVSYIRLRGAVLGKPPLKPDQKPFAVGLSNRFPFLVSEGKASDKLRPIGFSNAVFAERFWITQRLLLNQPPAEICG
jgi:hypothetical protein